MTKDQALQELIDMLPAINKIFENEPAVLRLEEPIMIIGDIHGNLPALNNILEQRKEKQIEKILFLGDYIDRGEQGVEVLQTLFSLKIAEPNNIFLLRGNHEDKNMNKHYGFFKELGRDHNTMELLHQTFKKMSIAAIVDNQIFCVHGGIPLDAMVETITKENSIQYLWNDPMLENGIFRSRRGIGAYEFGPDVVDKFLEANKLVMILRSHTALSEGYGIIFDAKLISLFSCPGYNNSEDIGVYAIFKDAELTLHRIEVDK